MNIKEFMGALAIFGGLLILLNLMPHLISLQYKMAYEKHVEETINRIIDERGG